MTKGRKPKPSNIRRLQGNPAKRPINLDEPEFEVAIPDAPPNLNAAALVEWNRITQDLASRQVISTVDMAIVGLYCQAYEKWVDYSNQLENETVLLETPKGYKYPNPLIGLMNTQAERLAKYAAELGITPSSRSRIRVLNAPKKNPENGKRNRLREAFQKTPAERLFNAKVKA